MSEHGCPPIDELMQADVSDEVLDHTRSCGACTAIVDLVSSSRGVDREACEEHEVVLSELVAGTTSAARSEALQRHLQQCEGCNRAALRLMLSQRELDDVPDPPLDGAPLGEAAEVAAGAVAAREGATTDAKWRKPMGDAVKDDPRRLLRTVAQMGAVAAAASLVTYFVTTSQPAVESASGPEPGARDETTSRPAAAPAPRDESLDEATKRALAAEASAERAEARVDSLERRLDGIEAAAPDADPRVTDPLAIRDDKPTRADDTGVKDPWGIPVEKPATGTGKLSVACSPMCDQVTIDGTSVGPSPVLGKRLAPGRHTVVGRYQGRTKSAAVVIEAGTTRQMRLSMGDSRDRGF